MGSMDIAQLSWKRQGTGWDWRLSTLSVVIATAKRLARKILLRRSLKDRGDPLHVMRLRGVLNMQSTEKERAVEILGRWNAASQCVIVLGAQMQLAV